MDLTPGEAARVVLDTNAVLDWLVFQDARMAAAGLAITQGHMQWLACAAMRDELERTLAYRSLAKWQPDSERVLASFDAHAVLLPAPPPAPLSLRCSDPDDQVFLDLALAHRAGWLLTHDRALLRLARRARALGTVIVAPRHWLRGA